ncbi:putative acetyl-CoA synthetase [Dimargaris cristalligena]|uniref:Acetyl-coenzyme A synthetase n=1 Tax=Dimargaris cristalligena TaxID=215637 RepID=A0A4V1J452_9FUNG|nr:putative acetyl-CoA synthetase [Dimargaris cristalligena]|eukprot:RKP34349.1 putative acetyl-CoA synthetase [Dimargaris cristalligena]
MLAHEQAALPVTPGQTPIEKQVFTEQVVDQFAHARPEGEVDPKPIHSVPARLLDPAQCPTPHITSMEQYRTMYDQSLNDPDTFWGNMARDLLHWSRPFTQITNGTFEDGDVSWFADGELNASVNCLDRHAQRHPDRIAIIHEADEPGQARSYTYKELLLEVCRVANLLISFGLRKGNTVAIYMPMIPQAAIAMLACARIGCIHSVVFAGFSADSLAERILDANSAVVITADEGRRGGRVIPTKRIVDDALKKCPNVKRVLTFAHTGATGIPFNPTRDVWWHEVVSRQRPYCAPVPVNAEDPLFLLYTSGSTGKPKGVVHSTGGYLLGVAATVKYVFDAHDGDIFGCTADVGWITGHSYLVYGPLSLGITTVFFESVPTYPDASRYWKMVEDHKITQFYTAPTAIRALRRLGDDWVNQCDLSSLRVIGSVGEPINPEAWNWYNEVVGHGRCAVVDTYWQTETGANVITPLPGCTRTKPGSATFPFFGIEVAILDAHTGQELEGPDVTGVLALKRPWPAMARTIAGDHPRYLTTYMHPYRGYYFSGDGATRDADGYIWIRGRVDDVINVSGHRLSTSEIESALVLYPAVAEAAVVGAHDDVTGQSICAFVTLKPQAKVDDTIQLTRDLVLQVRKIIGPFASPKAIMIVDDLPKTRSGKIIRRILRKVVAGEADSLGDLSTVSEPAVVQTLVKMVNEKLGI